MTLLYEKVILKTRSSRIILISYMYMVSYTYVFVYVNVNIVNSDTARRLWLFKAQRNIFKASEVLQVDGLRWRISSSLSQETTSLHFLEKTAIWKINERYVNPDNLI